MKRAEIVVVGSGSLAGGVVQALSQIPKITMRVAIVARSMEKIARLTAIANARAALFGASVTFEPLEMKEFKALAFSRAIRSFRPKVIFQAASVQSPWEAAEGENGWTKLVKSAGFGITLPLQMALVAELSRGASDSKAAIVNASYPDAVNVALHRVGLRVTCGIGNAAIVEAFCRANAKTRSKDVRVVGHHGHLSGWISGDHAGSQPRVWMGNREVDSLRLRPEPGPIGEDLNSVTSATSLAVILALLTGQTLKLSIPGVAGFAGGYPFTVRNRKFHLRLPLGITQEQAIAHNQAGERLDGLDLGSGVRFVRKAEEALAAVGFEYAQGFDFSEWPAVQDRMMALRERLRSASA